MSKKTAKKDMAKKLTTSESEVLKESCNSFKPSPSEREQELLLESLNRRRDAALLLTPELSALFGQKSEVWLG